MFKKACSTTIISLVTISSFLAAEIEYDICEIGTLQTKASQAIALNKQGQILGWYNIDGSTTGKQFFLRNRDGIFYELPSKETSSGLAINWQYLTDDGKAYGTFDPNTATRALCVWDQQNGIVKLGVLPGKEIVTIKNEGRVLIKSVEDYENGKSIKRPLIWKNGQITKLKGLGGNLGIESEESCGFDMNNKGEVVGQSLVSLNYKNEIYKQIHAVKWTNGQAIDLHNKVPKSLKTHAIAINDLGEVLIYVGEIKEYLPKYLLQTDNKTTVFSYDLNKLNNVGYVYNCDYNYGVPVKGTEFMIQDRNGKDLFHSGSIKIRLRNDSDSIWTDNIKLNCVNDHGEMIVQGTTVYGEEHAMLLTPVKSN